MTAPINPKSKRQLLFALLVTGDEFSTSKIAETCKMPKAAVRREMERLGWKRKYSGDNEKWQRK